MQFVLTSIHQRATPIALREQLAFDDERQAVALHALGRIAREAMILSTCNRVEIAAWLDDDAEPTLLAQFLADWHGLDNQLVQPHVVTEQGERAVRHLFRLAAGLDSMVLGEEQIMRQLKDAAQAAAEVGILGPHLRRLLDAALATGKLVHTQTSIARLKLSVVSVAVDLARRATDALANQHVLIIGAGRMAELTLKHVHGQAATITVASRTHIRAAALADRYGVHSAPIDDLPTLLASHDLVFSCTSSPELVIDSAMVARATVERTQPLRLFDLAVPRDIDPLAGALPGVQLVDVDAMKAICEQNLAARGAEVETAEALVAREVAKMMRWWSNQKIVPTIRALCEHAEAIRATELERALTRLSHLGPQDQATIGALSTAIVNKLLHQLIASLKQQPEGDELAVALQQLFLL